MGKLLSTPSTKWPKALMAEADLNKHQMNRRKVSHMAPSIRFAWVVALSILSTMLVTSVIAQSREEKKTVTGTPITAGEVFTLHSKILGEDRTVYVALPASYTRSGQTYPVLYLTDAQWNFAHTQTSAAFLARNRIIPEVIVVGVTNRDRTRDLYATRADFKRGGQTIPFPTSGNADQFLEFFEKELITWTEANYRTVPLRVLAGHSAGGNFALHAMRTKPRLFQAVIATSPWLAWDDHKERAALVRFFANSDVPLRNLFFSYADEGAEMKSDIDAIINALQTRKIPTLRWKSATYPTETHDSTGIKSYYDGLRIIFDGWEYPRDPQTNLLKGSVDDLRIHYRSMSTRLGADLAPPESVVNEFGYERMRANAIDDAIATFRLNTENFPRSANVWDSLGEAQEKAGKLDDALVSYKKSVTVAEANGDPNIDNFRKNVTRLGELLKSK